MYEHAMLVLADLDGRHGHLEDLGDSEAVCFIGLADLIPIQRTYRCEAPPAE